MRQHAGHRVQVHDTPSVDSGTRLEGGMVVTVEPGLYIPPDDPAAPAHFRGLGIRIEDDVLVASVEGARAEVLTAAVPKRADEMEALLAGEWHPRVCGVPGRQEQSA